MYVLLEYTFLLLLFPYLKTLKLVCRSTMYLAMAVLKFIAINNEPIMCRQFR